MAAEQDKANTIVKSIRLIITNLQKMNERFQAKFEELDKTIMGLENELRGVQVHVSNIAEKIKTLESEESKAPVFQATEDSQLKDEVNQLREKLNVLSSEFNLLKQDLESVKRKDKVTPELIEESLDTINVASKTESSTSSPPAPSASLPPTPPSAPVAPVSSPPPATISEPQPLQKPPDAPSTAPTSLPQASETPLPPPAPKETAPQPSTLSTQEPLAKAEPAPFEESASSIGVVGFDTDSKPPVKTDDPEQKELLEALRKLENL